MFNEYESKQLTVVYKDELLLNWFRKLVQSRKEPPIELVAWDEGMWLSNKKSGELENTKVLFIGDVKGVDKLEPVIDCKFDYWGIKYGWAGKRAIILADSDALYGKSDYHRFLDQFKKMCNVNDKKNKEEPAEVAAWGVANIGGGTAVGIALGATLGFVGIPVAALTVLGANAVAALVQDNYKNKKKILEQQYLYGVSRFFSNDLDDFMNA